MVEATITAEPQSGAHGLNKLLERGRDAYVDQREVASLLSVTARTVRAMVTRGELRPPMRIGRIPCWRVGDILDDLTAAPMRPARAGHVPRRRRPLTC